MTDTRPARKQWDLILTIIFLILSIGTAIVGTAAGALLAFSSDSCGAVNCNLDQISAAIMIGLVGPGVIFVLSAIATVILLVRRRIAFWVPIAGGVLTLALLVLCYVLASAAIGV